MARYRPNQDRALDLIWEDEQAVIAIRRAAKQLSEAIDDPRLLKLVLHIALATNAIQRRIAERQREITGGEP